MVNETESEKSFRALQNLPKLGKNQLIKKTGSFRRPNSKGRKTKTSLVFGNLQPKKKKKVRKISQSDMEMFSEPCRKHSKDQWAAADRCWLHGHY